MGARALDTVGRSRAGRSADGKGPGPLRPEVARAPACPASAGSVACRLSLRLPLRLACGMGSRVP